MEPQQEMAEEEASDFLCAASSASIGTGSSCSGTEHEAEIAEEQVGVATDISQMVGEEGEDLVSLSQWRLLGKDEKRHYKEQERQRATRHALDLALEDIMFTTSDPRLLAEFIAQLSQIRDSLLQRQEQFSSLDKNVVIKQFWRRFERSCSQYGSIKNSEALENASTQLVQDSEATAPVTVGPSVRYENSQPIPAFEFTHPRRNHLKERIKPSLATPTENLKEKDEEIVDELLFSPSLASPQGNSVQLPKAFAGKETKRVSTPTRRRQRRRENGLYGKKEYSDVAFFTTESTQ